MISLNGAAQAETPEFMAARIDAFGTLPRAARSAVVRSRRLSLDPPFRRAGPSGGGGEMTS
jgi:hypothetical protein